MLTILSSALYNCNKKDSPGSPPHNDTISLKHISFEPAVTGFKLANGDSVYLNIYEYDCYAGPHLYTCSQITIKSNDTAKLNLSYGGHGYGNLDKDSIIDNTLPWMNSYLSGGWVIEVGEIGYRSNFVGLQLTEGESIYYGWIHTPSSNKITEYAIDTTIGTVGTVRAGQFQKY